VEAEIKILNQKLNLIIDLLERLLNEKAIPQEQNTKIGEVGPGSAGEKVN